MYKGPPERGGPSFFPSPKGALLYELHVKMSFYICLAKNLTARRGT